MERVSELSPCRKPYRLGGTSFKRYLEVAPILGVRTAVVRDNDGDHQRSCAENYEGLLCDTAKVFGDLDPKRDCTFEICIHQDNADICDELSLPKRHKKSVLEYMLHNKADAALAGRQGTSAARPQYARGAIAWIRESP